jgi:Na+-driven multidrug efflux pump/anti-sigma regulatory factor (Ser/Thr protein kinase)
MVQTDKEKTKKNMIGAMFLSSAIVMILTQIIGLIAIIIDGIITSRVLGTDAYSSIDLIRPFVSVILMLAGFLSVGNQVICSRLVGEGKKSEANGNFAIAMILACILSSILLSFCIFMPDTLLRVCGVTIEKHPDFYGPMIDYLNGYMLSIPAILFIQVMGPVIVLDNNKSLFRNSAYVLCITDIIGDLLNAFVFKGGTLGMGLATTISYYIQLIVLITHFFRKTSYFHLSFKNLSIKSVKEIIKTGFPALVTRLATALRNLFISRYNLTVALTAAGVAAKGIQGDVNSLMFCFSLGLGRAMMSLSSLYYGAKDRLSIKRLFKYAVRATIIISVLVGLALYITSPLITFIYTSDDEVHKLAVFGICCMAIGLVFDALATIYMDFLQGTGKRKLVNFLVFFERFFIPVSTAYILGSRFGTKGVLASLALSKPIMLIVILITVLIYRMIKLGNTSDLLLLPEDFGGSEDDNLYAHIETIEDVMRECSLVEEFCIKHGANKRVAKGMALALEELGVNVINHGKKTKHGDYGIDYRLTTDEEEFTLTIRDLCQYFDPIAWYEVHQTDEYDKNIGLKIITGIAKETRYFNAFNSNNIIFKLDRGAVNKSDVEQTADQ